MMMVAISAGAVTFASQAESSLSVFGRPGCALTLDAVVEHAVEALLLQQEEHRLPVIAGAFHPRRRSTPQVPQPVRQFQQLTARGAATPGSPAPGRPGGSRSAPGPVTITACLPMSIPAARAAEKRLVLGLFHRLLLSWGMRKKVTAARRSRGQAEIYSVGSKRQYTAL